METITLKEAVANATEAAGRIEIINAQPAAKPSILGRIAKYFVGIYIRDMRRSIAASQQLIDQMPAAIDAEKAEAQREYGNRLKEIDRAAALEVAQARFNIHQWQSRLARLEGRK